MLGWASGWGAELGSPVGQRIWYTLAAPGVVQSVQKRSSVPPEFAITVSNRKRVSPGFVTKSMKMGGGPVAPTIGSTGYRSGAGMPCAATSCTSTLAGRWCAWRARSDRARRAVRPEAPLRLQARAEGRKALGAGCSSTSPLEVLPTNIADRRAGGNEPGLTGRLDVSRQGRKSPPPPSCSRGESRVGGSSAPERDG